MPERVCSSSDSLRTLLSDKSSPLVVNFTASWAPQCAHVTDVLKTLSDDPTNSDVRFANVDAEVVSELSKEMGINVVPTVIIMQNGAEVHRVCGAKIAELTQLITGLHKGCSNAVTKPSATNADTDLNTRLSSASQPRCGFSRQILELLNSYNVTFDTFDILLDEEVRQGLKTFSNWPTYPQLYVKGELIGGLDIVKELAASGELADVLKT
ncbi:hypothetical protein EG68_11950 [Paragonimus skrjabini miyazakii]|uniref:Thioredoxin domain-containing protein n=1 Tax=Paragonimus skrjabini miyazakii TaxID=59628 RepID=A0A8S9YDN8_9TREM|nr:hypothetical protein EG68_11950 [Paragonimus skrjabini miyazakii]